MLVEAHHSQNFPNIASMFRLRHFFMILGFLLFIIGVLSVVFILIGANFSYLAWIDKPGSPRGIIIRILMIGGGLIMSYMALYPPKDEEETNHVP